MQKKYIFLIGFIGFILLLSAIPDDKNINTLDNSINSVDELKDPINLKSAAYWELTEAITIDDSLTGLDAHNWTWAVSQAWCSGSGIYGDPFLIENVSITISSGDFGISIENSNTTTYFRINNVTIVNTDVSGSGILLNNTYNGEVFSSTCNSMVDSGIKAITAINTTIDGNILNLNAYGLYMDNTSLSTISGNSIINNTNTGLYGINCTYNTIGTLNDLTDNNDYGIYLHDSDENDIDQNYIRSGNDTGICIIDCDNCTITSNTIAINIGTGLLLNEDDENSLLNVITGNDFDDNGINANDSCTVANSWYNGTTGNDWDSYPFTQYDGNDDGRGDVAYTIPGTAGAIDRYPIFNDGAEPSPDLSDDDDVDDLFADEKNIPGVDWTMIGIYVAIGAAVILVGFLILHNRRKIKGSVRKTGSKISSKVGKSKPKSRGKKRKKSYKKKRF